MQDYDTLMEQLVDELQILVNNDKWCQLKTMSRNQAFLAQYNFYRREKEEYRWKPDTTEDFQYQFPLKVKFDQSSIYKDNKIYISKVYKQIWNRI
jgi:hypothetical protein